jgi:hypothetical protein
LSTRKTVRSTYLDFHGADGLPAPDAEEWRRWSQTLELRDMGTHLCALPAGEHCSRAAWAAWAAAATDFDFPLGPVRQSP